MTNEHLTWLEHVVSCISKLDNYFIVHPSLHQDIDLNLMFKGLKPSPVLMRVAASWKEAMTPHQNLLASQKDLLGESYAQKLRDKTSTIILGRVAFAHSGLDWENALRDALWIQSLIHRNLTQNMHIKERRHYHDKIQRLVDWAKIETPGKEEMISDIDRLLFAWCVEKLSRKARMEGLWKGKKTSLPRVLRNKFVHTKAYAVLFKELWYNAPQFPAFAERLYKEFPGPNTLKFISKSYQVSKGGMSLAPSPNDLTILT